jgi:hypothetical protein
VSQRLRQQGAGGRRRWCYAAALAGSRDAPGADGARRGRAAESEWAGPGGAITTCARRAVGVGAVAGVDAERGLAGGVLCCVPALCML